MKVLTWNCGGAFRKKFYLIDYQKVDIAVIQECENPAQSKDDNYKNWATNFIWIGDNKNKGLGVFCNKNVTIQKNDWDDDGTKYFISATINNRFNLIAVWAHYTNLSAYKYIDWSILEIPSI